MVQKTKGLGANPLAKKAGTQTRDRGLSLVGALSEASSATTGVVRPVKVSDIARNPENPEDRWADEGLIASVREVGVLVPLTLMSAEVFLGVFPEHVEAIGERPWVALAGHRRHDAAEKAEVEEVPALARDDLGERAGEVMLGENLHRTALSPLQEARAYQRNLDRTGLSQRKLAAHLGVPQSQISKRLTLLALPEVLFPFIDAGELDLETAATMVGSLSEERVRDLFVEKVQAGTYYSSALREAQSAVQELERREAGQAAAEVEGVEFVASPGQKFGSSYYNHQLHSKSDIAKARKAGTLVIGPAGNYDSATKVTHWTTAKPARPSHTEQEKAESKARTAARKARRAYLETADLGPLVTDTEKWQRLLILHGISLTANWTTNARKLCQARGVGPESLEDWGWRGALTSQPERSARVVASLITLSLWEDQLAQANRSTWSTTECDWFDWMVATGYAPTEWELERRQRSEPKQHTTPIDQSDSAESLPANQAASTDVDVADLDAGAAVELDEEA